MSSCVAFFTRVNNTSSFHHLAFTLSPGFCASQKQEYTIDTIHSSESNTTRLGIIQWSTCASSLGASCQQNTRVSRILP